SDAHFGPNLSRVAAKLGVIKEGQKDIERDSARRWLIQWIMNPTVHSPRTYMPITHLNEDQANDIAVWLLSQTVKDWKGPDVPAVTRSSLQALATVHLEKILTRSEVKELFTPSGREAEDQIHRRLEDLKRRGADEGELAGGPIDEDRLKMYLGRKAINQLGCFGCHDIPGFEQAKPIGT